VTGQTRMVAEVMMSGAPGQLDHDSAIRGIENRI